MTNAASKTVCSILVDTNIWLDFYLPVRLRHAQAYSLLRLAVSNDVQLLYAAPTIRDVHYLLSASLKKAHREEHGTLDESTSAAINEAAWKCAENMAEIAIAVAADQSDIWLAMKYRLLHNDFDDDLVIAASLRSNASLLVTNDEKFLTHSPVPTLNAEDALALLQAQLTENAELRVESLDKPATKLET